MTVAIPLAARVREVVAVDPDSGMLTEGRRLSEGVANVRDRAVTEVLVARRPRL
ncbi:hypothetical protein ABT294_19390 [Nonomuraea sp. NPDC000554]|uniref:hypothetical protein n=1 Tax=Nonomuraea sp. NPDC000554 TaxID=3154259 RepID=UPI00331EC661